MHYCKLIDWRKNKGKPIDHKTFLDVSALSKLWTDLKDLLNSVHNFTDVDMKLKDSLYDWGLQYA